MGAAGNFVVGRAAGRIELGHLRPALLRGRQGGGQRVPGQQLHHRSPVRAGGGSRRRRRLPRHLDERRPGWLGSGTSASATTRRALASPVSSGSTATPRTAQYAAAVTRDAADNFIVAWDSDGQDGALQGVYAKRYRALLFGGSFEPGDACDWSAALGGGCLRSRAAVARHCQGRCASIAALRGEISCHDRRRSFSLPA